MSLCIVGLPRFCSASLMFAEAHTDDFYCIMRKRAASVMDRMRGSANGILNTLIERLENPFVRHWVGMHMHSQCFTKATLLILQACEPYILLTANMEDVHALAQQLAASPVVDQVKKIWRRASVQFQKELAHNSRRQGGTDEEDHEGETETDRRTRRIIRDLVAIGKETGYLEPIKQVLQKINEK